MVPTVILFDLGGVLVDFAGYRRLESILQGPIDADELRVRWLSSAAVREFELGRLTPENFADRFVEEWSLPMNGSEFLSEFREWPRGLYPGVAALLAAVSVQARLACLSNSNATHWPVLSGMLGDCFEHQFVSHQLGLAKPDPAVFDLVKGELKAEGSEILFLDDAEPNVAAAEACGLRSEVVRGPRELVLCLDSYGLSTG
ncbi:MAG: HAD-IA family hydrolase [Gammaproteobacteria bacterium]|nr:HAD-IA family hydrolase [Gammaproteobacteria bacterium]